MKRAVAVAALVLLPLLAAPPTRASIEAADMCVTIYENFDTVHDKWKRCGPANALYNANLTGDIVALSGTPLCNTQGWPIDGNDWNDCVSGAWIDGLPAGWAVRFYWNANYSGGLTLCTQSSGFLLSMQANDQTSSWRVSTGSC